MTVSRSSQPDSTQPDRRWWQRRETRMVLALLVLVLGAWAFWGIADEVMEGDLRREDEWVLRAMRTPGDAGVPRGPAWVAQAARDITSLGGVTVMTLVVTVVTGHLLLRRHLADAALVLAASAGAGVVGVLLKLAFRRDRPTVVPALVDVSSYSFPSGHAMMSAVVYLTLGVMLAAAADTRRAKTYYVAVAVVLTVAIGLTRMYLGVHYPSDVMAGWTAGLTWALACRAVRAWVVGRGDPLTAQGTPS